MANDQSTGLPQLNADEVLSEFDLRNCPTPDLTGGALSDLGSFDPLDDDEFSANTEIMSFFQSQSSPKFLDDDILTSTFSNVPATVSTSGAMTNVPQTSFSLDTTLQSAALINSNSNSPFNSFFSNNDNSFMPIEAGSLRQEDISTPLISENGDTMSQKNSGSKAKCMSRNAILARANREKKKTEQRALNKRLEQLEEENAALKKKCSEYKTSHENDQKRITYLEAILQNIPQIINMVEHMKSFPPSKGSSSNSKKT